MKKIKTLFERVINEKGRFVTSKVTPGCEWVLQNEGIATIKFDGTCCMVKDGIFYKRYDCKRGKTPPLGFVPCQEPDEITGHWPGWLLVSEDNPQDKWHVLAFKRYSNLTDGTYELCGPHFNDNPERIEGDDCLIPHGKNIIDDLPIRDYESIKDWLKKHYCEGIVFHHRDGMMCKIKRSDFGYDWKVEKINL